MPHDPELFSGIDPRHLFACGEREVLALLDIETPEAVDSLPEFADFAFRRIRPGDESLVELSYAELKLGSVPALRSEAGWEHRGRRFRARILVWRNGWKYVGLIGWSRESHAEAAGVAFDELVAGLDVSAPLSGRMQQIGRDAQELCPHLSQRSIEYAVEPVLRAKADAVVTPEAVFRLAYARTARGLAAMAPADVGELGRLNRAAFDTMAARDRDRLGAWLELLRAGQATRPADDRALALSLARAVRRLPEASQARLRALTQNAIALGS